MSQDKAKEFYNSNDDKFLLRFSGDKREAFWFAEAYAAHVKTQTLVAADALAEAAENGLSAMMAMCELLVKSRMVEIDPDVKITTMDKMRAALEAYRKQRQ